MPATLNVARCAVVVALLPVVGCAARAGTSSTPFVKKGAGFIDVGGHTSAASEKVSRDALRRAAAEAAAKRAAEPKVTLPTIEKVDPALRDAPAAGPTGHYNGSARGSATAPSR